MAFTPPFVVWGRKVDDEDMAIVGNYGTEAEAIAKAEGLYDNGSDAGWFATVVKDANGKNVRQFGT
jgi:hypothetical protein